MKHPKENSVHAFTKQREALRPWAIIMSLGTIAFFGAILLLYVLNMLTQDLFTMLLVLYTLLLLLSIPKVVSLSKCPSCKRYMGRDIATHCPHCKTKIQ